MHCLHVGTSQYFGGFAFNFWKRSLNASDQTAPTIWHESGIRMLAARLRRLSELALFISSLVQLHVGVYLEKKVNHFRPLRDETRDSYWFTVCRHMTCGSRTAINIWNLPTHNVTKIRSIGRQKANLITTCVVFKFIDNSIVRWSLKPHVNWWKKNISGLWTINAEFWMQKHQYDN